MIKVKISSINNDFPLIRQTPENKGQWGECMFYINQYIEECDYWVILDNLSKTEHTICSKENIILITGEPPSVKKYNLSFLRQFATVVTCHQNIKHSQAIFTQQALPWMVGAKFQQDTKTWDSQTFMNYDFFLNCSIINKSKEISIITSNKRLTKGHKQRALFIEALMNKLEGQIDIYGQGYRPLEDKWDGLADYKYSIILENSSFQNYWTEKLSDAFLAETFPIYYGCPNIIDYFPEKSMVTFDINNIDQTIDLIKNTRENSLFELNLCQIKKAKDMVLNKYNVFALIESLTNKYDKGKKELCALSPQVSIKKQMYNWITKRTNGHNY